MSPRVREGENETAVHQRETAQLPTLVRQPQAALEAPVRDLQATNGGAVHAGGQLPHAGHAQHAAFDNELSDANALFAKAASVSASLAKYNLKLDAPKPVDTGAAVKKKSTNQ